MAEDGIALIKRSIQLSKYIAQFTEVKPGSGKNVMAFCPLHDNTKTPAMSINDNLGLWKCFAGCGGGSIIDFWMLKNDNNSMSDALESLSQEMSIQLPERPKKERGDKDEISKTRIRRALERVAERACDNIFSTSRPEYKSALAYLDERNVPDDIIEKYLMGIIPEGRDAAVKFIKSVSEDIPAAIAGGALMKNEDDGSLWSPLAGRLTIPIFDRSGGIVGFGARQVPGVKSVGQGKWINPTTTPVYDKSKIMYGLDQLKGHDGSVVVVEGYFDAIAITESSIEAVGVACCGTAFTTGHLEALNKVKDITFIFDGDDAGAKALSSSYWVANKRSDSSYASLPSGTDPWELMFGGDGQKPNKKKLINAVNSQNPLMEGCITARYSIEHTDQDFDEWVADALRNLSDSFSRDQLITAAAKARGYSRNGYNRAISNIKLGRGRSQSEGTDKPVESQQLITDPNTSSLVTRILQMDEETHQSTFGLISKWDSYIDEVIEDWFPGSDGVDANVFRRVITGGLDMDPSDARVADQSISSLLPGDDQELVDVSRSLRSIMTLMAHESREVMKNADLPEFLSNQILSLRRFSHMASELEYQPFVLGSIIDIGLDIKRFERLVARQSDTD